MTSLIDWFQLLQRELSEGCNCVLSLNIISVYYSDSVTHCELMKGWMEGNS